MQTKSKQHITSTNGMSLCPTCVYYKGTYEGCMLKNLSSACHVTSCDEYVNRYKRFKLCWLAEWWERMEEKYPDFFDSTKLGIIGQDTLNGVYCEVFTSHKLINPIRLRDELAEYFGWEE